MAANVGRKIEVYWGADSPPAKIDCREKGIALNGEPINVSDDGSDGWRELLDEPGEDQVTLSLSGVTKDDTLKRAWFSRDRKGPARIVFADGGEIAGTFFLASYTDNGTYNDAHVFETELQSSGPVTYTPAAT